MWGSKNSAGRGAGKTTLISQGTIVLGDLHFTGNVEVEGLVRGNIVADVEKDAQVRVVGKGSVEGEIRAPNIVINGTVKGDVHCTGQLELAPKGRVNGNVYYAMVEMAAGAEVNGGLTHVTDGDISPGTEDVGNGDKTKA